MPIGGPMTTWCETIERGGIKMAPGDVREAINWFKETTGQEAKLIVLNPRNEKYANEAGEDIVVEYSPGCPSWEILLSPVDNYIRQNTPNPNLGQGKPIQGVNHLNGNLSILEDKKISMDKLKAVTPKVTRKKPGPKIKELPEDLIKQLNEQGLGSNAIATSLKSKGIEVSYKTIQRIINGQRQLSL